MQDQPNNFIYQSLLEQAADLIEQADSLIIAAGAGMGIDSGLPDFRGAEGFWRAYPALRDAQLDFRSIASPRAFRTSPEMAWGFYGHRLALYRKTEPHLGFDTLKRWGEQMPHGYSVFTSNVDGQFQIAGFDPGRIHECHGSIHHLQCLDPCGQAIWDAASFTPEVDTQRCQLLNKTPMCPACGGLARPNILMFGDEGWIEQRTAAQCARQSTWLASVSKPVVIEVGAGTVIPSVRHFSHLIIHQFGGRLIRINPSDYQVPSRLDVGLPVGALAGITAIARALAPQ